MKKVVNAVVFLCIFCLLAYNGSVACAISPPAVAAKAAILIEQSTGRVLYEQNADERLPMASTTKIMTALLVLENANLDDVVTIDARSSGVSGSSMFLEAGETLTVKELLYGLMIRSGNDAASALALHVAGDIKAFAQMMNDRAAQMGLKDTHFVNPHGLPADDHYTTARELARIAAEAMKIDVFREIVSAPRVVVPWDGHEWDRVLTNKNRILKLIEGGNGIKTGFTKAAGRCLVSSACQEDMQLIAVTLNCADDFNLSAKLLQYGFDAYDSVLVYAKGTVLGSVQTDVGLVDVIAPQDIRVPVGRDESVSTQAVVPDRLRGDREAGSAAGHLLIYANEDLVVQAPLVLAQDVHAAGLWEMLRRVLCAWNL